MKRSLTLLGCLLLSAPVFALRMPVRYSLTVTLIT